MLQTKILWEEDAILWFGTKGEKEFGRRNFMDLLSMITSEPLFAVRYGRTELGFVHEISFATRCEAPTILLLAGRSWQVNHLDWKERVAYVEPSSEPGRSRWIGSGEPLSSEVCQAMQRILASDTVSRCWSRRAKQQINELRGSLPEIQEDCTTVVSGEGFTVWWTFAGGRANACIVAALQCVLGGGVAHDDLSVVIPRGVSWADLQSFLASLRRQPPSALPVPVSEEALAGLKFSICLPRDLAFRVLEARLHDPVALECVLNREVRYLGEAPR
jgi:ATP-dependent Lhr-like helicase